MPLPAKLLRWRTVAAAVLVALVCASVFHVVRPRKPLSNSEPYRAAHGIVSGRTNEVRVGGMLFRFPPEVVPEPETGGEIVRGQADSVMLEADLSSMLPPQMQDGRTGHGRVTILIRAHGFEDAGGRVPHLEASDWQSVRERPELGMREYIRRGNRGGAAYPVLVGVDPRQRTPRGGPVVFECVGVQGVGPTQCMAAYRHPRGPCIWYRIGTALLPRWREVKAEVERRIDAFIVGQAEPGPREKKEEPAAPPFMNGTSGPRLSPA